MELKIKVLGPGCAKCKTLERLTKEVVSENHMEAEVIKVEDIVEIMNYHIFITPALVIDEKVVHKGSVPSKQELKRIIEQAYHDKKNRI